jgi:REP element-mobilizing transposase RayT
MDDDRCAAERRLRQLLQKAGRAQSYPVAIGVNQTGLQRGRFQASFQQIRGNGMPVSSNAGHLRIGRFSEPGRIYLVTTVVHQRQSVFTDWRMGRLVVQELSHTQEEGWVDFLAWVVMPDHMHCLVQLRDKTLAELMCRIKSRSSLAVNQALERQGRLWQKGYHDRVVRRGEDVKNLARYVIANPIRAGLVERVHDYPLWDACWL